MRGQGCREPTVMWFPVQFSWKGMALSDSNTSSLQVHRGPRLVEGNVSKETCKVPIVDEVGWGWSPDRKRDEWRQSGKWTLVAKGGGGWNLRYGSRAASVPIRSKRKKNAGKGIGPLWLGGDGNHSDVWGSPVSNSALERPYLCRRLWSFLPFFIAQLERPAKWWHVTLEQCVLLCIEVFTFN
jgi:hypothetical protein